MTTKPSVIGTEQQIREILLQELELSTEELTDTGHLVDDYDADSLSLITIASRIEAEVGITIPSSEWPNMTTLNDVFAVVQGQPQPGEVNA